MTPEDELNLSFYKDISDLNGASGISLVKHVENGRIFVKKTYKNYDPYVLDHLLRNPIDGIPRIYEIIHSDDDSIITIEEYVNGITLRKYLSGSTSIKGSEIKRIITSLCRILSPLHKNEPPIIHRDIKPENIILYNGKVYLIDFDASKAFNEGRSRDTELIGTKNYAAPEQYGFGQSDPRTDIYALGIVMKEMLTGDPEGPFESDGSPLGHIISKCVSLDPKDRYSSCDELEAELSLLSDTAKEERPDVKAGTKKKMPHSRWMIPGFRTGNILKMLTATLGYLLITTIALSYTNDGLSGLGLLANKITMFIIMIALVLFYCDYLGIKQKLPLIGSNNILFKIAGYGIYTAFICVIPIFALLAFGLLFGVKVN